MLVYLFDKVLFLSLAGGAAILAVGLFCTLGGKWLTCRWRYYIWLLPTLLLLLPVALPAIGAPSAPAVTVQAPAVVPDVSVGTPVGGDAHIAPPSVTIPQTVEMKPETAVTPAPPVRKTVDIPLLPILWLAGIAALSLWHLIERLRFRRFARRATDPAREWEMAILDELRSDIGLHKNIALRRFHGVGSPFLCGVLRPTVYLPAVELTQAELRRVLTHELTHCRRHDLAVKRLVRAVRVLHWYNPLVWLMERQMGTWCELSCDEAVVDALGHGERQEYGLTILKLMKGERSTAPVSAYLAEKEIKNRLEVIMREKHGGWARRVLAVGLSLALCLGCTALAAEVGAQNPNQNNGFVYTTTTFTEVWCSRSDLEPRTNRPGEEHAYIPGTGAANTATGTATLVDLPGNKRFSADVTVNLRQQLYGREYFSGPTKFRVEMTKLTGVSKEAGKWSGLFTVWQDGEVLFENMTGIVSGVPSLNGESITEVFVKKWNGVWFRLSMSFGLSGDQVAQSQGAEVGAEWAVENATDVQMYCLNFEGGRLDGTELDRESSNQSTYVSAALGQASFAKTLFPVGIPSRDGTPAQIFLRLDTAKSAYTTDGTVRGLFTAEDNFNTYVGEFNGTLSGLNGKIGETVKLRSDDGKTDMTFTLGELRDIDYRWTHSEQGYGQDGLAKEIYQPLAYAGITAWPHSVSAAELPFTLSWDKSGLALKFNGGTDWRWTAELFNEAGEDWFAYGTDKYAATHEGYPMFQDAYQCRRTEADAVGNTVTLPFADDKPDHYILRFGAYSTETGASTGYYEVELSTTPSGVLILKYYVRETIENPNVPADIAVDFVKSALPEWVFEA